VEISLSLLAKVGLGKLADFNNGRIGDLISFNHNLKIMKNKMHVSLVSMTFGVIFTSPAISADVDQLLQSKPVPPQQDVPQPYSVDEIISAMRAEFNKTVSKNGKLSYGFEPFAVYKLRGGRETNPRFNTYWKTNHPCAGSAEVGERLIESVMLYQFGDTDAKRNDSLQKMKDTFNGLSLCSGPDKDNIKSFLNRVLKASENFPQNRLAAEQSEKNRKENEKNNALLQCAKDFSIAADFGEKLISFGGGGVLGVCEFAQGAKSKNAKVTFSKSSVNPGEMVTIKMVNGKGVFVMDVLSLKLQPQVLEPRSVTLDGKRYSVNSANDVLQAGMLVSNFLQ
jgi:hypothetical protein